MILIVIPAVVGGVLLLVLLVGIVWCRKRYHESEETLLELTEWQQIRQVGILQRLGGGQFGDVYKGLMEGNTEVALKKLRSNDFSREFQNEVKILMYENPLFITYPL